ncbi:MAG TPA: hypothetical protein PLH94_01950 [Fimbriimonadaceae bacterium]|nr:hypothetical protein [Fimbriimonadaceae bacterium]
MVLRVDVERFADEVRTRLAVTDVYVSPHGTGSLATAAHPDRDLVVCCLSHRSAQELKKQLESDGLKASSGAWSLEGEDPIALQQTEGWIAAVAYRTAEAKPGLWVDAYPDEPSPAEVLMNLYEEFRETGELGDYSFEDFMRQANVNVVIVGPEEAARFVERNAAKIGG